MLSIILQAAPPTPPFPGSLVLAFVLLDVALILVAARLVGFVFVKIGVVLSRQFTVGLLDFVDGRIPVNSQSFVKVIGHISSRWITDLGL